MARDVADGAQRRRVGGAAVQREPAPRQERAARRGVEHAGRLAGDGPQPPGVAGHRDRLQQAAGVGVVGLVVGGAAVGLLDRLAAVHDHDLVGDVGDHAQVMTWGLFRPATYTTRLRFGVSGRQLRLAARAITCSSCWSGSRWPSKYSFWFISKSAT